MESAGAPLLLTEENGTNEARPSYASVWAEANKVARITLLMIVVTVSQYLMRISPLFMLSHLGELSLSSSSIATSFANVTGYSILFGMAGALETLCGQAYGAKKYHKVGTYTSIGAICLSLVCVPVTILWLYTDKLLMLMGHETVISVEAGKYTMCLIPSLFPYAIYQSLVRYLQIQSMILPMLFSSVASLCFHLPLLWVFVFKLKLGNPGAALSISISYWLNVIMLGLYVKYFPTCKRTHPASFTRDAFRSMKQFLSLAIQAALMICLRWWLYLLIALLSGYLPNPELEKSALSICFNIISLHYHIPNSFAAAASTRISNELGAGKPMAAQMTFYVVLVLSVVECITVGAIIFGCGSILGYAFSNDPEVIDYVYQISSLLSLCIVMDGFEAVLLATATGCGWQHIAVYADLWSYYLVGLPVALVFGFFVQLKGKGLWWGLLVGSTLMALSLLIIMRCTDWEKQAMEARKRIFDGSNEPQDELLE